MRCVPVVGQFKAFDVIPRSEATRNLLYVQEEKQIPRCARNDTSGGASEMTHRRPLFDLSWIAL